MSFAKEFKEFISRGNVMDMAVGIIIGSAFTAIVTSLVDSIIKPLITIVTGGNSFGSGWAVTVNDVAIDFGAFIAAVINFLIIALVVFVLIKSVNKMHKVVAKEQEEAEVTPLCCPYCKEEIKEEATRCSHCGGQFGKPAKTGEEVIAQA